MHDIVIRGGTIVDGTGKAPSAATLPLQKAGSPPSAASKDLPGARSMPWA